METKAQELARLVLNAERSVDRKEAKEQIKEADKLKYLPS